MKTIILDIAPRSTSPDDLSIRMDELESLVSTYGGVTVVKRVQRRDEPNYRTYVGEGKLQELADEARELGVTLLVIGNILKPAQIYQINEFFRLQKIPLMAWDRVDLILKIFAQHAVSPESKIQIELAAIKHMWPRISGMGLELSSAWRGGGQSKGKGETNTEIMRRHLRDQGQKLREELLVYERTRAQHRQHRKRSGLKTVGIVWYTNAGKSTLMNALTNKWVLAENKLFATLGTSVGKVWMPTEDGKWEEFLLNDTIGFIRDLPPDLISAFKSTLEDSVTSDLLLHTVDASDRDWRRKIDIVDDTLHAIGATQPRLMIFNKIDLASEANLASIRIFLDSEIFIDHSLYIGSGFVSAFTSQGTTELKETILQKLTHS